MMRKLVAPLVLVIPLALSTMSASASQSINPSSLGVSGVVAIDPHVYGRAGSKLQPALTITNVDTTADESSGSPQNETSIAVNPLNPSVMVGGDNDYRPAANDDVNCGYTRSSDGGATWTSGILLGITAGNGGPFDYDAAGDPSLYYGPDGTVYYSCLAFDRSFARSAIVIESSSDGGVTWSTPIAVSKSSSITLFNDKDMITVDRSPSSPFRGRIYDEWAEFYGNLFPSQMVISYSSDRGATWSTPTIVSGSQNTVEGASPAVGPDGTVYATWCSSARFCESNVVATIYVSKSTDGGVTWSAPTAASTFVAIPSPLPTDSFRDNSFPTAAVNPVNGHVYISYADYSLGSAHIEFVSSTDGGATWSGPTRVNNTSSANQFFQWMAVSQAGVIRVCYYDQEWNTKYWLDMSCSSSFGDANFGRPVRITTQSSNPALDGFGGLFIGDYTGVDIGSHNSPHALWTDTRTGNADAWTNYP